MVENKHHLFYVGGSDKFDSFMLLFNYIHAPFGAYYEKISVDSGILTLLIENSRSLPHWGKMGLYATAVM